MNQEHKNQCGRGAETPRPKASAGRGWIGWGWRWLRNLSSAPSAPGYWQASMAFAVGVRCCYLQWVFGQMLQS